MLPELAAGAALAMTGSAAYHMAVRTTQAIDAELAARCGGNREAGGVVSTTGPAGGGRRTVGR